MRTKNERQWGFDLTTFGEGEQGALNFKEILKKHNLSQKPIHSKEDGCYIWANASLFLVTGNNPLNGKYGRPGQRDPELGYASYIGIEGYPTDVEALASSIREKAEYIKEEVKHERQFI